MLLLWLLIIQWTILLQVLICLYPTTNPREGHFLCIDSLSVSINSFVLCCLSFIYITDLCNFMWSTPELFILSGFWHCVNSYCCTLTAKAGGGEAPEHKCRAGEGSTGSEQHRKVSALLSDLLHFLSEIRILRLNSV